jgi:hypothetical protein
MLLGATGWQRAKFDLPAPFYDGFAQDSTFLHARALYEFLCGRNKKRGWVQLRMAAGIESPLPSRLWDDADFRNALQLKVFHLLTRWRPHEPKVKPYDDLSERVVEVAQDVLDVWTAAIGAVTEPCRTVMTRARADSIAHSAWLADQLGMPQPAFV